MDIAALRELFPVTSGYTYLNSAAEAPLNVPGHRRLLDYLKLISESPQMKPAVRTPIRRRLSELLGGSPEEYALVTSTGAGIGIAAGGIDWSPGDNVVLPCDEHWNNTYPWLALRNRGVEVRLVETGAKLRVCPEKVAAMVDARTRVVAVAAVRFNSGFRSDLKALSAIAHDCGALFLVDGIQATGVMPVNVDSDGIDILACGGFKWLLGLPGTGFLYVKNTAQPLLTPTMPGMFAAENDLRALRYLQDARRYETGSIAYPLFYSWEAGLEMLQQTGIQNIHARVLHLTERLINGLAAGGMQVLSPVDNPSERSAIVIFSAGNKQDNAILYEKLTIRKIVVTLRDDAIRVSPSFFNTEEDIDSLLNTLQ